MVALPLLFCKHFVRLRQGTTAYVYPVPLMMPFWHRTLMGYSHVGSQTLTRALRLCAKPGFFRRRFNLFDIKHYALQSWWYALLGKIRIKSILSRLIWLPQAAGHRRSRYVQSPRLFALSCLPTQRPQYWHACALTTL